MLRWNHSDWSELLFGGNMVNFTSGTTGAGSGSRSQGDGLQWADTTFEEHHIEVFQAQVLHFPTFCNACPQWKPSQVSATNIVKYPLWGFIISFVLLPVFFPVWNRSLNFIYSILKAIFIFIKLRNRWATALPSMCAGVHMRGGKSGNSRRQNAMLSALADSQARQQSKLAAGMGIFPQADGPTILLLFYTEMHQALLEASYYNHQHPLSTCGIQAFYICFLVCFPHSIKDLSTSSITHVTGKEPSAWENQLPVRYHKSSAVQLGFKPSCMAPDMHF
jgi:hypothetical protein